MSRSSNPFVRLYDDLVGWSISRGPVFTFILTCALAGAFGYVFYYYVLTGWYESTDQYRRAVLAKEIENERTEAMLANEPEFKAKFKKVVELFQDAKPLLPEDEEVSEVLGQVETAANRNGVTLTGLVAVQEAVKSPNAEKLYEREIPALVTGPYPQVVRFFTDISRMPRILLVRDYSIVSLDNSVSAGFTLIAYNAPPPAEMPAIPEDISFKVDPEVKSDGK
ncbi:MAG TPA: type 4a pilus biogenesis protein PilO [Aridibacter sp.]|nr:type 4a pilus biogenesis protein PilO [Aridibacter sp.]